MANARSQFDMIAGYFERAHEVQTGLLYGKPCLRLNGDAFAAYALDGLALRLHGRSLAQALQLPGVKTWDPLRPDHAAPGWVLIPAEQALRWDRLALDALRCAREAAEGTVSYALPPPPPVPSEQAAASTAEDLGKRAAAALSSGFGSLRLTRAE